MGVGGLIAKDCLGDLPRGGHEKLRDDDDLPRHLVVGQPLTAEGGQCVEVQTATRLAGDDLVAADLAEDRVRHADAGGHGYAGDWVSTFSTLDRVDVVPALQVHLLSASAQDQLPGRIDRDDVPGHEPPVVEEGLRRLVGQLPVARFPDLVIVAGHIGYPWTAEMVSLATKYPNVYIDTSAYVAHRYPPELVAYLRGHGRSKVLFGSNYPMATPRQALVRLDELELDEATRRAFLAGNAAALFHLLR